MLRCSGWTGSSCSASPTSTASWSYSLRPLLTSWPVRVAVRERHSAIAARAVLTERARQWAFEQVGEHDAAVAAVAAGLGVAWWTVMGQVIARGTPLVADPGRLDPPGAPVTAVGVDETSFLRATGTHATIVHHRHR